MKNIFWSRVALGALASFLVGVLILGVLIGIVVAFSSANSIQDVRGLPRFSFVTSVLTALAAAWGAYFALRDLPARHSLHGLLIGLSAGLLNFVLAPGDWIANILTLLMALPAGVFGSRIAERNPRKR